MEAINKEFNPEAALLNRQQSNAARLGELASIDLGI